jgi:hypothetical protein
VPLTSEEIDDAIEQVHAGNPRPFMEGLFVVASKYGELVPFTFNRLQDRMHEQRTGHDYWLKFRQGGSSVYHLGVSTAKACCTPYFNTACITLSTDRGRTKERLFQHVKRFVDNLPDEVRPSRGHERADYIEFDKLHSQIYIGTVGSREFGRSETIHRLIITEMGSFTTAEAEMTLTSAIESVVPGGEIIFETTPKLMGSPAHRLYVDCKLGKKPYKAHFAPWYWCEDYWLREESFEALEHDRGPIILTEVEELLATHFEKDGVPVADRIRWRRAKLADRETDFYSEYPEDELTAWQASTHSVFPADRIRQMMQEMRPPSDIIDGVVRIYKEHSGLRRYVIGADAAAGVPGGDNSALVVLCVETGEVVAVLHGLVGGATLIRMGAELATRYKAPVGGERDAWTLPLLDGLERLGIEVYYHEDDNKMGFPNTNTSRVQGMGALRGAISENDFRSEDEALVQELSQYARTTDPDSKVEKYGAPPGLHDDLVDAAQRAQQMRLAAPGGGVLRVQTDTQGLVASYEAVPSGPGRF